MNRVQQPRTLLVLGLNARMSTAAGADELVEIPYKEFRTGPVSCNLTTLAFSF